MGDAALSPDANHVRADEVEALPDGSALAEMIADYGVMREQARAFQHRQ